MKKLLLILLLPVFAQSQSLEFKQYFTIEPQVVEVDSTSADELYKRLKNWVMTSYNEPNEVIVVDTPKQIRIRPVDDCFMTYKPLATLNCFSVRYQITLDVKDNKFRFSFGVEVDSPLTDIPSSWIWKKNDGTPKTNGQAKQLRASANKSLNKYFNLIKTAALNSVTSTDDDW